MRFLHAAAIAILLVATMTTSVWSGGAKWGPSSNTMVWAPSGATPSGRPVPAVAIGGTTINNQVQSASWSLGPSDPFADLTPADATFTFIGQLSVEPDDAMVISTGWGPMWGGRVVSVSETLGVDGLYRTTVTATDKVGQMGLAALRKVPGKVGTLVEVIEYLARVAGVRVTVTDASTGTYGLITLQRFAYWSQTFTGSMLEYLNIAARSSNAMVALQPDGSLRVMTREALTSAPTTVTLTGDNSPSSWTRTRAWGNDVNRWTLTAPNDVDYEQAIPADIRAHGERAFTVDNWLDAGDTPPWMALANPFLDWWAYTPSARWVVTDGQFVVGDLDQEELLTLAPLDWITVLGETWQVMSMQWSIDGPGQPMRLAITADSFLTVMSGIDPGPAISGVTAYDVTDSGATITWDLSEPGTGYVEYGTTTAYGSETTHETSYTYSTHIQTIEGLTPGTTYHYRVRSSAPSGDPVETISPDHTFETAALLAGFYGPGIFGDTLANTVCGHNSVSDTISQFMRFRAEQSSALNSFRFYFLSADVGGTYGAGTGGTWKVELFADDETADHFPTGSALATQTLAATTISVEDKVVTFSSPYTVTAGTIYHIVITNTDANAEANYFSPDYWYAFESGSEYSADRYSPKYPISDYGHGMKLISTGAWVERPRYLPVLDITYANGEHQGMSYGENSHDAGEVGEISGTTKMVRERFTVSGGDKVVSGVVVRLLRSAGTGDLTITLRDSSDVLIDTATVTYSDIPLANAFNAAGPDADEFGYNQRAVSASFSTPQTLSDATEYRLRLSCAAGTTYWTWVSRRLADFYGYVAATAFEDGYAEKTTDGSTWTELGRVAGENDLQFAFIVE